eukprot:4805757-Prymnesium_polylepis.3
MSTGSLDIDDEVQSLRQSLRQADAKMQAEHARVHADQQSHQELLRGERQAQNPRFCGTAATNAIAMFGWLSQVIVLSNSSSTHVRAAVRASPLLRCDPIFDLRTAVLS